MREKQEVKRIAEASLMKEIRDRKSPLVLKEKRISERKMKLLIEAARWAPSSFNNQPWNYIFVNREHSSRKLLEDSLMKGNEWAKKAPASL